MAPTPRTALTWGAGSMAHVSDYQDKREQHERRRRNVVRAVCLVVAAAMLLSIVIPAIYAGL